MLVNQVLRSSQVNQESSSKPSIPNLQPNGSVPLPTDPVSGRAPKPLSQVEQIDSTKLNALLAKTPLSSSFSSIGSDDLLEGDSLKQGQENRDRNSESQEDLSRDTLFTTDETGGLVKPPLESDLKEDMVGGGLFTTDENGYLKRIPFG